MLRVALLGLGGYAKRVAEAIKDCKRVKITGLISGTPDKLKSWGSLYGVPENSRYNYENFDRVGDNPDIDAVYIITPNALHKEQAIRVARAKKHVICEKPMALNAKEGEEMIAACKAAGVQLLVGYRLHFENKTTAIIRMRQEGEFGRIRFFQGLSGFKIGDPSQWRMQKKLAGGGALMDIGIYAVNGARYMVGEEPIWVTAQETKTDPERFKEGVDETIQFQLGFPGGAVASCLSTYNMSYLDRFFLNGEKGFAEMQPSTGYGPLKARTHKGELDIPHVTHQTLQMDGMAALLLDGKKPLVPVDGEEGLKDLKILDAIYAACASGKKQMLKL
ncbi:Gfo/Idh/MocA family oxidoreductase [Ravibacter arvi]|uniref:Gfo/Idh/MocA family oxidoreductase n=1 Tax=Ravibacter arvi TaxID=2051041 RepID=A0ABP8LWH4_9BACT